VVNPSQFGRNYSTAYDRIYHYKDYGAECDFIEALFRKYDVEVKTILDIGCGTGGHLVPLAERGYHVTGVDRSKYMLAHAEKKIIKRGIDCELIQGDLCQLKLDRAFDAVISMFAVMGYLTSNAQLASACRLARHHVRQGGVFIFDGWYGPGVLNKPPTASLKSTPTSDGKVVRFNKPTLNMATHTVENHVTIWVIEKNRLVAKETERHHVRLFFHEEIRSILETVGFGDVRLCPFLTPDEALNENTWYLSVIGLG